MKHLESIESKAIVALVDEAIRYAGGMEKLAKIIKVSRVSIWSWQHNEYLPSGRHLLTLMNYVEQEKCAVQAMVERLTSVSAA